MDKQAMVLQVECTHFFAENPYALETAESLAMRLGRMEEDLVPILERLVEQSVLTRAGGGDPPVYRYVRPITVYGTIHS